MLHVSYTVDSLAEVEVWGRGAWRAGRAGQVGRGRGRTSPQNELWFAAYLDAGGNVDSEENQIH